MSSSDPNSGLDTMPQSSPPFGTVSTQAIGRSPSIGSIGLLTQLTLLAASSCPSCNLHFSLCYDHLTPSSFLLCIPLTLWSHSFAFSVRISRPCPTRALYSLARLDPLSSSSSPPLHIWKASTFFFGVSYTNGASLYYFDSGDLRFLLELNKNTHRE